MPNKTIYVKDTDLPLLEQAQTQLGDSVSSMFAEFLRERVARLTPEENSIIELINQIIATREIVKKQRNVPEFIESEHAEAQAFAEKALKSFRAGEIRKTKAMFWAANAYYERAQRDAKEVSELNEKIGDMLGRGDAHTGWPRK
jgi:iron uptake system EfeUOB component EfeO/EfeM